ncbi:MAG: hypothetical protein KG003_09110 [Bacteroidetes bacterium]|nr:hypothetical protein [Bacteroidota bacterium]
MKKILFLVPFFNAIFCFGQYADTSWKPNIIYPQLKDTFAKSIRQYRAHYHLITTVHFNKAGTQIISGGATAVKLLELNDTGTLVKWTHRPFAAHEELVKYSPDESIYVVGSYGGFKIYNSKSNALILNYVFQKKDNWAPEAWFNAAGDMVVVDWFGCAYYYSKKLNQVSPQWCEGPGEYGNSNLSMEKALTRLYGKSVHLPYFSSDRGAIKPFDLDPVTNKMLFTQTFQNEEGSETWLLLWDTQKDTLAAAAQIPDIYLHDFILVPGDTTGSVFFTGDSNIYYLNFQSNSMYLFKQLENREYFHCLDYSKAMNALVVGTENRENKAPKLFYIRFKD